MSFAAAAGLIGPALIAGGSIGSALIGANAATTASGQQVSAEEQALALQQSRLTTLNPYIGAGNNALAQIAKMYGPKADYSNFTNSPDYQFALQQGNLGVQRYENANGLALSGGAIKDVAQFNQGLATQQFGNYYNRLMGLAQLGSGAAQAGVTGGNAAAGTLGSIGASAAGGTVGSANAITGGINSGISNSLLYNAINRGASGSNAPQSWINPSGYTPQNPVPSGTGGLY